MCSKVKTGSALRSANTEKNNSLRAHISPIHYYDHRIFDRERRAIFSDSWTFAGLTSQVSRPDDYFLTDVGGTNMIVQNFEGELKAFVNSCSHRHSRIHSEQCGNRKLVCPYHGWAYDNNGIPAGIREKDNFPDVLADPTSFGLRRFDLDCAGSFIFLRNSTTGQTLQEFLGHTWDFLLKVSDSLDRKLDSFEVAVAANWKVVVENAVESYHVPMVHRSTFAALNNYGKDEDDMVDELPATNGHSRMTHKVNDDFRARWKEYELDIGSWPFRFEHYCHQLIFPNLAISSILGHSFHITRFRPDSAGQTTIELQSYAPRFELQTHRGAEIMASIHDLAARFNRKVIDEDKRICEQAFLGCQQAGRPAVLANDFEQRVAHFQQNYLDTMGKEGDARKA